MTRLDRGRVRAAALRLRFPDLVDLARVVRDVDGYTQVDFDLLCSKLALDFWADPSEAARPVVDVLRELEAERRRYLAALTQLRERLLALTKSDVHQHLPLPIEHYQEQVRDRLFPDLMLRPLQTLAASSDP